MAYIYAGGLGETSFTTGEITSGYQIAVYTYGGHIAIPSAGTVTSLGAYIRTTGGSVGIKLALYDDSGNLVANSTATVSNGTVAWVNSGAVSGSVSTGTYYVLVSGANNDDPFISYSSAGNGSTSTEAYATFPANPETVEEQTETSKLYGVRVDFTAGGTSIVPRAMANYRMRAA